MISPRLFLTCFLLSLSVFATLAGPPLLTSPENNASDQPADLTLSWEAGALTNYISEGGFEKGGQNWSVSAPWIVRTDGANAFEGTRFAEILLRGNTLPGHLEAVLYQQVSLPRKGLGARLLWRDYHSSNGSPENRPRFKVDYFLLSTQTDKLIYDVPCGEGSVDPWNQHELDLSQILGRTFVVTFSVSNQVSMPKICAARLDDVRIEVTPESVTYEVYLGPTANLGAAQLLGTTADTSWNPSSLAAGSTNYWKVIQITDGVRVSSPVFGFVVGGSAPVEAPPLLAELSGGQLHLHATTQAGGFYQFEQTDAPESGAWQPIGNEITGDGAETAVDVPLDGAVKFFRLRVTR